MDEIRELPILPEQEEEELYPPINPVEAAEAAGLHYVSDGEPGYTRKKRGKHFLYFDLKGKPITSAKTLERIKALVIPPAWEHVWISPKANGHIQATGRDKKGRKQYRYHPQWSEIRSLTKFGRLVEFGEALPKIRVQVDEDLRRTKLTHEKVTALVVRLLEQTMIRVGNAEYARKNNSYGLTTLLNDHITIEGSRVMMDFIGKKGKHYTIGFQDRRLANLVKRCQDLPGQQLFSYLDENGQCCQTVTSDDVNRYLRQITGEDFSAKDFRTWGGTLFAAIDLYQRGPAKDEKAADKQITQVIKEVSAALGNTPTVCRKYYVHPGVLDAYRDGRLFELLGSKLAKAPEDGLAVEEQALLELLRG